jgi:hypothetical protein
VDQVHKLPAPDRAPPHAPYRDASEVLGVVEVGDEHLERGREVYLGGGDLLQHRIEELAHVVPRLVQVPERRARAGDRVERIGKSSCSSEAPRSAIRSKVRSTISSGRASVRSTLLTTTMGLRPSSMA